MRFTTLSVVLGLAVTSIASPLPKDASESVVELRASTGEVERRSNLIAVAESSSESRQPIGKRGLAASQARMLMLVARKQDLEGQAGYFWQVLSQLQAAGHGNSDIYRTYFGMLENTQRSLIQVNAEIANVQAVINAHIEAGWHNGG